MTSEEYKALSVKEFTEAAKVYDSGHSGIYEMCKDDYPYLLEELEKEPFDSVLDCGCGTGPVIELLHEKYPDKQTVFIGLFMVAAAYHGRGVGSKIVSSCFKQLAAEGYTHV